MNFKERNKHVDAAVTVLLDAGSTPAISTGKEPHHTKVVWCGFFIYNEQVLK